MHGWFSSFILKTQQNQLIIRFNISSLFVLNNSQGQETFVGFTSTGIHAEDIKKKKFHV